MSHRPENLRLVVLIVGVPLLVLPSCVPDDPAPSGSVGGAAADRDADATAGGPDAGGGGGVVEAGPSAPIDASPEATAANPDRAPSTESSRDGGMPDGSNDAGPSESALAASVFCQDDRAGLAWSGSLSVDYATCRYWSADPAGPRISVEMVSFDPRRPNQRFFMGIENFRGPAVYQTGGNGGTGITFTAMRNGGNVYDTVGVTSIGDGPGLGACTIEVAPGDLTFVPQGAATPTRFNVHCGPLIESGYNDMRCSVSPPDFSLTLPCSSLDGPGPSHNGPSGNPGGADGGTTTEAGAASSGQPVTVTRSGGGSGSVWASGLGLSCGAACTTIVAPGMYTMYANWNSDSYFAGWGGDAPVSCGRNRECRVTVASGPLNITARFERGTRLTVLTSGYVGGSFVDFDPSTGQACNGMAGSFCTFSYAPGDTVRLYTRELGGSRRAANFLSWSGVTGCAAGDDCTITIGSTDVTVTANFTLEVLVAVDGTGTGRVTTSPAGIDCTSGTFCGPLTITPGQSVTFSATPNAGSAIDGWTAINPNAADRAAVEACGSAPTCTLTPTGYLHVKVTWKPDPSSPRLLTIARSGTGTGTVGIAGSTLNCGAACTTMLAPGMYTMYANWNSDSYFAGWGGDAPASCGRNRECRITVASGPLNITARFERGTRLTVLTSGYVGSSFVEFDPSTGQACNGTASSFCTFSYAPGDTVRLYTREVGGSRRAANFLSWSGVTGCAAGDDCTVTIGSTDLTVTATFTLPVWASVSGMGTVTMAASAGSYCRGAYCAIPPGQSVTFAAAPAVGWAFLDWRESGNNAMDGAAVRACGSRPTCTITPTGRLTVTASFVQVAQVAP